MRTIRTTLLAALLTALVAPAGLVAQDALIGVRGGLNVANLDLEDAGESIDTDPTTGLVAGVFAQFAIGDLFAIRPEGLLSRKGAEASDEGVESELEIGYVDIPILLVARFGDSAIRPVIFAGPVISFETSCEFGLEEGGTETESDCADAPEDPIETESTDFGAAFGAGLEIDAGSLTLLLDGRYTLGLRDIDPLNASAKNRVWSFMAGAGIDIG